jgi:hypothetical protein
VWPARPPGHLLLLHLLVEGQSERVMRRPPLVFILLGVLLLMVGASMPGGVMQFIFVGSGIGLILMVVAGRWATRRGVQ